MTFEAAGPARVSIVLDTEPGGQVPSVISLRCPRWW
jgi:hypothetical protein